jgi:hypothetical protein
LKLPGASGTGNFGLPLVGIAQKGMSLFQGGLTGKNLFEGFGGSALSLNVGGVSID